MTDDGVAISGTGIVGKIQTMVDGSVRVSIDFGESQTEFIKRVMEMKVKRNDAVQVALVFLEKDAIKVSF